MVPIAAVSIDTLVHKTLGYPILSYDLACTIETQRVFDALETISIGANMFIFI